MRVLAAWIAMCGLLTCGALLRAQSEGTAQSPSNAQTDRSEQPAVAARSAKKGAKRNPAITPEREAAVLSFVQRNHAELVGLLGYLKISQPDEYDRALREVFRTTERLAFIQERDPLQYELEVAAWSAQSHVQLLAAELHMNSSEDLVKQLRQALLEQHQTRLALVHHDRKKTSDRLIKLDNDIARLEKDENAFVDSQLKTLTRAAAEGRPTKSGSTKANPKTNVKAKKPSTTKNPTN